MAGSTMTMIAAGHHDASCPGESLGTHAQTPDALSERLPPNTNAIPRQHNSERATADLVVPLIEEHASEDTRRTATRPAVDWRWPECTGWLVRRGAPHRRSVTGHCLHRPAGRRLVNPIRCLPQMRWGI
jgi:hypothetical protein